jgi:Zn-dependent protease with chaperone function
VSPPFVDLAVLLASFAAGSLGASAAIRLTWPWLRRRLPRLPPEARAGRLLALRLGPTAAGAAFSLGFVLPAFVLFEPVRESEPVGPIVLGLAAAGLLLLGGAAARLLLAAGRTRAAVRDWQGRSEPAGVCAGLPMRRIGGPSPAAVLAGVRRPRLFIASEILDRLEERHLEALAAHERAHHESRDNALRLLWNACADPVSASRAGRESSAQWELALEEAADRSAVSAGASPEDLAEALLAVARFRPRRERLEACASAFDRGGRLERRVRSLLAQETPAPVPTRKRLAPWIAALAIAWVLAARGVAQPLHEAIERVVHVGTESIANYDRW